MMSNLSESDRRTLRFGGIAVAAILLLIFVGFPLLDQWDRLDGRLRDAQKKLAGIRSSVEEAAAGTKALQELETRATLHPSAAVLNQQTARMLQQVESLPAYRGITVRRLEGLPVREEETYYRSGVSLQFSGNLRDLHRFLQEVEGTKPALKVERITVTADTKNASRVEGQMVISGYAVVVGKRNSG
jgi:hypothetical protein